MSSSQAALKLIPHPPKDVRISRSRFEPNTPPRVLGAEPCCPSRNGDLSLTVPAFLPANKPNTDVLEGLRARMRTIDRTMEIQQSGAARVKSRWRLGARELDSFLSPQGLHPSGVHEIKPCEPMSGTTAAGSLAAAMGFALRLSARRLLSFKTDKINAIKNAQSLSVLWCNSPQLTNEIGELYGPGLYALGFDPSQFLIVEAQKSSDVLWAIEEGLRSKTQTLIIGCLDDVALTPARRLSLAAQKYKTPCLLVTNARTPGAAATKTRWRIAPAKSSTHPLVSNVPGPTQYQVLLEHQRGGFKQADPITLEWCDETHRFGVVSGLADRTHAACGPAIAQHG